MWHRHARDIVAALILLIIFELARFLPCATRLIPPRFSWRRAGPFSSLRPAGPLLLPTGATEIHMQNNSPKRLGAFFAIAPPLLWGFARFEGRYF